MHSKLHKKMNELWRLFFHKLHFVCKTYVEHWTRQWFFDPLNNEKLSNFNLFWDNEEHPLSRCMSGKSQNGKIIRVHLWSHYTKKHFADLFCHPQERFLFCAYKMCFWLYLTFFQHASPLEEDRSKFLKKLHPS